MIYIFHCPNCQKDFEEYCANYQSSSVCPVCKAEIPKIPALTADRSYNWGNWRDFGKKKFGYTDKDIDEMKGDTKV